MGDNGKKHNNVSKTNTNETVTPVGNSWVICRSKSYSGRIYYFNTSTGDAAWNLSSSEVEKAKNRTQSLGDQPVVNLENCPEPPEPPMDHANNNYVMDTNSTTAKLYNQQIVNNRFAKQPFQYAPFLGSQYGHIVSPAVVNALNPPADMRLNLRTTGFNHNVWSVPPTHQILFTPSVPILGPGLNQNLTVQTTTLPLSARFHQQNTGSKFTAASHFSQRNDNSKFHETRGHFQRQHLNRNRCNDLRELLENRRHQSMDIKELKSFCDHDQSNNVMEQKLESWESTNSIKEDNGDTTFTSSDSSRFEQEIQIPTSSIKMDLTNLRKLAKPHTDPDIWYIAVDSGVLLNNLNLLNILLNSDDQCQLLVPSDVQEELRAFASGKAETKPRVKIRANRALAFLSKQIEDGCAILGDTILNGKNVSNSSIVNSCLELEKQNFHVILLSNNTDLRKCKITSDTYYFTIEELKALINNKLIQNEMKSPIQTHLQSVSTSITVPNNAFKSDSGKVNETINDIQFKVDESITKQCSECRLSQEIEMKAPQPIIPSKLISMDVEVQTEPCSKSLPQNNDCHKREIRLKRFAASQVASNNDSTAEKKQFKWWRKRPPNVKLNTTEPCIDSEIQSLNVSAVINGYSNENTTETDKSITDPECEKQIKRTLSCNLINKTYDNTIDDSDASSSVILQKNCSLKKIIVEESSTSEIISNTEYEYECLSQTKLYRESETPTSLRFEVIGQSMEEYLTTRCDEWVSRFVQIMEEAFAQVLPKYPPFSHPSMPSPPWALHEAIECIPVKFKDYTEVNDIAEKLCCHLYKISDEKGKISVNLKPSEYMELYSYGVNLVDALQTQLNCYDLQAASESLAKLLKDIQNPIILDSTNPDTLCEVQDSLINETEAPDVLPEQNHNNNFELNKLKFEVEPTADVTIKTVTEKEVEESSKKSSGEYNLRSKKRKHSEEAEKEKEVKFVRNVDIELSFFKSLNLQKKAGMLDNKISKLGEANCENAQTNSLAPLTSTDNTRSDFSSEKGLNGYNNECNEQNNTIQTVFVRNFNKCAQFEEKLKNSINEKLDMDRLDYSANFDNEYDDCLDDEYSFENEYYNEETCDETERDHSIVGSTYKHNMPELDSNGCGTVDLFFKTLLNNIKETFIQVHNFCENARNDLTNFENCCDRKNEIFEKAGKAHLCIDNINKALLGIFYRETYEPDNSIQMLLKKAGLDHINDHQFVAYRETVGKCMDQANILLESINIIIDVVKH